MRAESETVKRKSLRESVFTGVLASPPNRNSFHAPSSLPVYPHTNVRRERLNHLLMSFPQLSLIITLRNNTFSDAMGLTACGRWSMHNLLCQQV